MRNGNRLLSLLMVVLGSVPSTMAVKRAKSLSTRRPSSAQASRRTGRTASSKRVGRPKNGAGNRKSSMTTFVLNNQGEKKVMKKKVEKDKMAVAVAAPVSAGLIGGGVGVGFYKYYHSDGQIRKRNLEKSGKFKNLLDVPQTSFSLLPAYEMKCDTSGKGNLETRPFVWLKHEDKWYVLMRKDNKTVKGALKGLSDLFLRMQELSENSTQNSKQYDAKVSSKGVSINVVGYTADKMGQMSTGSIEKSKSAGKGRKISSRVFYELGEPEKKEKSKLMI